MARTGPRRIHLATTIAPGDMADIDVIAEAAGVKRSDVLRAAVEVLLRGPERESVTQWLTERGRESGAELTPDAWQELAGKPRE